MVLKVSNSGPVHAGRRDLPHLHEIHPGRRSENAREVRRENLRHPVSHQYHGYRGSFKDIPVSGAFLDSMGGERDSNTGAFCVSMRFTIHYQEV